MDINNPAGRLLNILSEGKKANTTENCRRVWATILNVENVDSSILVGKVGKVFSLVDDIHVELSKLDNVDVDRYMSWTKYLDNAFSHCHLGSSWGDFIKHINEAVLDYLHMTSGMLSTNCPQPVLPKSDLDKIYADAKELLKEIVDSDLLDNIKQYFAAQLRKIIVSIEEYKITGSAEVVNIVEATFGKALLSQNIVEGKDKSEAKQSFWNFMAKVALVISAVSGTIQIADYAAEKFPELRAPEKIIDLPSKSQKA